MRNKNKPVKIHAAHLPAAERLGAVTFWRIFRAVMDYAETGGGARAEPFHYTDGRDPTPKEAGFLDAVNRLYSAMCDDVDIDNRRFNKITAERFGGAVDGVVYKGGMIQGVNGWVQLDPYQYYKMRELLQDGGYDGAEVLTHYIRYIDCAAAKTNNKNGWENWEGVIMTAIEQDWDGWMADLPL